VETASEIYDMVNEDVLKHVSDFKLDVPSKPPLTLSFATFQYPRLLRARTRVHIIQSREHILNTYSEKISDYAEKKFSRDEVDVITNARVKRVDEDKVVYSE